MATKEYFWLFKAANNKKAQTASKEKFNFSKICGFKIAQGSTNVMFKKRVRNEEFNKLHQ